MSPKTQELLENLVVYIATKAVEDNTPFPETVDALKAINAYVAATTKGKIKPEPTAAGEPTFADFQSDLEKEAHGETATIRDHKGRRPDA
jgi:hypothetical protein